MISAKCRQIGPPFPLGRGGFERVGKNRVHLSDAPAAVASELDGSAPVSPALNQDLEDLAFVIATARQRCVCLPKKARFARDSPLEGNGFELSVPGRETFKLSWETGLLSRKRERICSGTEGSNPSPSNGESGESMRGLVAREFRLGSRGISSSLRSSVPSVITLLKSALATRLRSGNSIAVPNRASRSS
jgi:hypothetical protein